MGSARAAAKAGIVTSFYFAGSVAALNALVLLTFKSRVFSDLVTYYSNCNGTGPATQVGSTEYCFTTLTTGFILIFFLQLLVISFFFAMAYGVFFEILPGGYSYGRKSLLMSMIMLIAVLFTVTPVVPDGDLELLIIVVGAEVVLAIAVTFFQPRLYRRFTREVEFQTEDPAIKILVGRRNQTGKKRTFSIGSTQSVEAVGEGKSFKGWLVSGGVTVDDTKNHSTNIHINGDGLLKAT